LEERSLFSTELRKVRKHAAYTQVQLASLAGISAAYISQLETGKKKPTDRVITKLSAALNIPENQFLIKIGKVKMDFVETLAITRTESSKLLAALSDEQWEELLTYLAYIKLKSSILG
jgi:transcriptional regulator with XRE-family HTH domain